MYDLKYRKIWLSLGVLAMMAVAILCLLPSSNLPKFSVSDKLVHFSAYFVLAAWFSGIVKRNNYIVFGLVLLAFSYLIELLQGLSKYRSFEWQDLLANGLGISVALLLGVWFLHTWCKKFETHFLKV